MTLALDNQSPKILSREQAYAATYHFLEKWRGEGLSQEDEIGILLGVMSLLPDGSPADRAIEDDWQRAVDFAMSGGEAGAFKLIPASPEPRKINFRKWNNAYVGLIIGGVLGWIVCQTLT